MNSNVSVGEKTAAYIAGSVDDVKKTSRILHDPSVSSTRMCLPVDRQHTDGQDVFAVSPTGNAQKKICPSDVQEGGGGVLRSPSVARSSSSRRATPTTMKLSARLKSGHE